MLKFKVEIVEIYRKYIEVDAENEDVVYDDINNKMDQGIISLPSDRNDCIYDRQICISKIDEQKRIKYNKLFDILHNKNISLMEFKEMIDISSATLAKFKKNEPVTLTIITKICNVLGCQPGDIMEI